MLRIAFAVVLVIFAHAPAQAATIQPTVYGDGRSCPGECDAHVVLHDALNGTVHAHLPTQSPAKPDGAFEKCTIGAICTVCFDAEGKSCIDVKYRGSGPPKGRFDFTLAFFEENCGKAALPQALAKLCKEFAAETKALEARINCIREPSHPKCEKMMQAAKTERDEDMTAYRQCRKDGEAKFNASRPPAEQRAFSCLYEQVGTGKNAKGMTWKRLLPAACKEGYFIGAYGTDCCSGEPKKDAPMGVECKMYYPAK